MFAVCVRWIMLLSFAVHAVLGCCVHHQHALRILYELNTTESAVQAAVLSSHVHCCCHHSRSADDAVPGPAAIPSPSDDCDCDGTICSFLLADSSMAQPGSASRSLSLDYIDIAQANHHFLASADYAVGRTDAGETCVPLRRLCAWQNSWQL